MNAIVKRILGVAEAVAVQAVPGANIVDSGVRAIIGHKSEADVWEGVESAIEGGIQAAESVKGTEIADQQMFRAGVALLHSAELTAKQGEALIVRSLAVVAPAL